MVALLVRLKLTLIRNSLRRSVWRLIGLIIAALYGLGILVGAFIALIGLRSVSVDLTGDITVVAFGLLTLLWLLCSLLFFGVDETVDPAKFALLPLRARDIQPGLAVTGLLGVPGIATVLAGLGFVATWVRSAPLTVAAVVSVPLGVATCLLLARTVTAAFASFLSSRRFRDAAFLMLTLFAVSVGLGVNLLVRLVPTDGAGLRGSLAALAGVVSWSPFGWAWALPADIAAGAWSTAGIHLILAVGLIGVLWVTWGRFLDGRLTSPTEGEASGGKVRSTSFVDRLYPLTPAGAVATRTLRYWRRDPRYLAGIAGFLVAPVILIVSQLANPDGSSTIAMFAPSLIGVLIGMSIAADLSYDGSAMWLHASTGLSGADDRAGRVMSMLTVYLPLMLILLGATAAVTGRWDLLPVVTGLTAALLLTGLGIGSLVGALSFIQWPAPPPGSSPFQRGSTGGLPAALSFSITSIATVILALPTIALVVWSFFTPWVGYLTIPVGLICGVTVLKLGIDQGGKQLDRQWPEILVAVSERSG